MPGTGNALSRAAWHPVGRWVVTAWIVVLVGVLVRTAVLPAGDRSVYPVFRYAGQCWLHHEDLYPEDQKPPGYPLFRYSPPVAVAFVPLAEVPMKPGDLVWRTLNAAVLLGGFYWALRRLPDRPFTLGQTIAAFVLLLPASPGGLGNGQCNAMVIGFVLAGYAAAAERRFTVAAIVLAGATLLKLYPVAPAMLLCALHPRQLAWRYFVALGLAFGLPFVLADPSWVARQYELWANYFVHEDRSGWPIEAANIDFQALVSRWITPMGTPAYRVVEAIAGLLFAVLTLAAARRLRSADRASLLAFGLGSVWMTTLGPATESPTYLLLAPATALATVEAWRRRPVDVVGRTLTVIAFLLPVSFQLAHLSKPVFEFYRGLGAQPVAGLVLAAALVWSVWAAKREEQPWNTDDTDTTDLHGSEQI